MTVTTTDDPELPLDLAELVLVHAIRATLSVHKSFVTPRQHTLLHVLGPRHLFPSITDAVLTQAARIYLVHICNAGDTHLLGKLLDLSVASRRRHVWVARHRLLAHSPHMLEGASERGHWDVLGSWFRLATGGADRTSVSVRVTCAMARRAIVGAAKGGRVDVVEWLLGAISKVLTKGEERQCWMFAYAATRAMCSRFLNAMLDLRSPLSDSECPATCLWCSPAPTRLFAGHKIHTQNFVTTICKLGHASCLRSILGRGTAQQVRAWIPHHALLVATKDSSHIHLDILDVFFQAYAGSDLGKFRVWDGVGIQVREWLLAHGRLSKQMDMDEVSRAGQVWILDWMLARGREREVPSLGFSSRAFEFKSSQAGVKSIGWWVGSGLVDRERMVVNVWVYCCHYWYELVEKLVAAQVHVSFAPVYMRATRRWPRQEDYDKRVVEGIRLWWDRAGMRERTGLEGYECLEHVAPVGTSNRQDVCMWSRTLSFSQCMVAYNAPVQRDRE